MNELTLNQIVDFLSTTEFFSHFDNQILEEMAPHLNVSFIEGGKILLRQGEAGKSLYIVMNGRLKATRLTKDQEETLGMIGQGEVVGEIALLVGVPRTATIRAVRDSILLEFSAHEFELFTKKFPDAGMKIATFCVKRLVTKEKTRSQNALTFAFAPASQNPFFSNFVAQFVEVLSSTGSVLHLDQKRFNENHFDSIDNPQMIAWLQEQEMKYRFIVYETESTLSNWTLRSLRQADRIILVGLLSESPTLNAVEEETFRLTKETGVPVDLVLLHHTLTRPVGTSEWLKLRAVNNHYHLHIHSKDHFGRLIRFLTGTALGLVLAGGGYRTYAFVGLFEALAELNIQIDFISGNSAGAILAGLFAMGLSTKEIKEILLKSIKEFLGWSVFKYTLPYLSVFNGHFYYNQLHKYFDDIHIEDLWMPYLCVSSNLTKNTLEVYRRGSLWKSIRASISIPGLLPPVVDENGELHVDGAIINNLPVDILRKYLGEGKIIAANLTTDVVTRYEKIDTVVSGWKLLVESYLKTQGQKLPNIGEVIISSMLLSSNREVEHMKKEADYLIDINVGNFGLLQTTGINELMESSYVFSKKRLLEIFYSGPVLGSV